MDIQKLIQIAEDLNLQDKIQELKFYAERLASPDKDLILPLVGEFSSGKTTLINSLLDNPNLETASRATTASIFEIRFGANECHADIVGINGHVNNVNNVADIKNSRLQEVEVVKVYDTSTRIGSSTILVDTPGLSSNDPAHKIALSSYLPNADAILLLTDVNQQLTRSLIDFLNASKLVNKPIYIVVTKCDTKTEGEVAMVKAYLKKTIEISYAKIITVSSTTGDMSQFDELIAEIQANKNTIVEKSIAGRVKNVAKEMAEVVKQMLAQSNSTTEIDKAIQDEQHKLDRINRNIDSLLSETEGRIEDKAEHILSQFSKSVFTQVDNIVKAQGRDCSAAVNSAVNSTAVMLMQNFQKAVMSDILSLARTRQSKMEEVPMGILETIEMAENAFNGFSSSLDVSSTGHEWDKKIGYGAIIGLAAAAVVVTAGGAAAAGGAAVGVTAAGGSAAAGAATASTVAAGSGATIAADVATDAILYKKIKDIAKGKKMAKAITLANEAKEFSREVNKNMQSIDETSEALGKQFNQNRGIIETTVGWVTDFFAKPARQRAVNNYIDGTLIPEFRQQILYVSNNIFREISSLLRQEALNSSDNIRTNLQYLKASLSERKEEYAQKIETYKQYANLLNEI